MYRVYMYRVLVTSMNTIYIYTYARGCTPTYIIIITLFLIILFHLLTTLFIHFMIIKIIYMYILPEQALKQKTISHQLCLRTRKL